LVGISCCSGKGKAFGSLGQDQAVGRRHWFWSALVILPFIICTRVFEIVARKVFGYASSFPQYLEWELFVFLVLLTLGYAYVRGAHIRVDIIRERLRPKACERIELVGLLLLMLPFALVVIYRGIIPIVGPQLLVISLAMAFPLLANWLPNQVFN